MNAINILAIKKHEAYTSFIKSVAYTRYSHVLLTQTQDIVFLYPFRPYQYENCQECVNF